MRRKNFLDISAIIFIFIFVSLGCKTNADNTNRAEKTNNSNTTNKTVTTDSETPIRSGKIIEAFKKDKDANRVYRGKTFLISGKITNINNVFDQVNINLRENETETGLAAYLKNVADKQRLAVGDEVIIQGLVRDDENGIVDNAEIVKIN